jgi:ferric-dicitrate binding protein FerR (iron transport regulator)
MNGIKKRVLVFLAAFVMVFSATQTSFAASVGTVIFVSGDAWLLYGANKNQLKKGQKVDQNQAILTGSNGRVRLLMQDKSKLFISPRSRIKLDRYVVKGTALIVGKINMFWGKVRFFVNKLRKRNALFSVSTRTAVLGVRGTEFEVGVEKPAGVNGSGDLVLSEMPPTKTSVQMASGTVVMTTSSGSEVVLTKGSSVSVDAEGNATMNAQGESSGDASQSNNMGEGAMNNAAISTGASSSVIQGSTITTPYPYRFGK